MSKHKTRQQKIIAQLHRKLQAQQSSSSELSMTSSPGKSGSSTYTYTASYSPSASPAVTTAQLSYIRHDLVKTLSVTSLIVAAQLLLYYCLKSQIITLPIGKY